MGKKRQNWLFEWVNPLPEALGCDFFRDVPELPGVYRFLSESGEVLYVGQSKNLKARLKSYCYIHPDSHSKRLVRLVTKAAAVEFQVTGDAKEALVLENRLLSELKPPFNRQNIYPEGYFYLKLELYCPGLDTGCVDLHFSAESGHVTPMTSLLFGAFKSRRLTFYHLKCLDRVIRATHHPHRAVDAYKSFPGKLINSGFWSHTVYNISFHSEVDETLWESVESLLGFLYGHSTDFVKELAARCGLSLGALIESRDSDVESGLVKGQGSDQSQSGFWENCLAEDLLCLHDWHEKQLRRLFLARTMDDDPCPVIPMHALNDSMVRLTV